MSGFPTGPVRSRILDEFAQIRAEHRASMAHIDQESRDRYAKTLERSAEKDREIETWKTERAKARAEAEKKDAEKDDAKPENAWAQPTRRADSAAQIGRFDDDDTPLPVPDAPSVPPAPVAAAPPARPAPATEPEPAPARGRHRIDDDDDFEGGSFVRG